MDVLNSVKKTLFTIIADAADLDDPLEKLSVIGGLIQPDAVSTSFQLLERGKVRELMVPRSQRLHKPRVFEDFQEKTVFDWTSEWKLNRRLNKTRSSENLRQLEKSFVEVEHAKKKDSLQFLYPRVHFCPCRYFQMNVLEKQTDWICVHLLAYYFSKGFGKMEKIECKMEIIGILKKILLRSVVDVNKMEDEK
ncbi:hypothetical protein CAEBREN_18323 [Caenorhabditis brenneri]|uniref:SWIM-type domain-containing protein n=1 Tax=Caenorhabditis brenneri TaxID=135651 RepID=G0N382_CAEBE|nr:hypothetical protein CAEBREN_18323 [Caenorhabditis brenneri]